MYHYVVVSHYLDPHIIFYLITAALLALLFTFSQKTLSGTLQPALAVQKKQAYTQIAYISFYFLFNRNYIVSTLYVYSNNLNT